MNATSSVTRVPILDADRVARKLLRMAWQIWERNSSRNALTLVGIADNGVHIARRLAAHLKAISPLHVQVLRMDLNKKSPLDEPINLSGAINDSSLVLVDDVANSGKTLLYALKPLMETGPEQILLAVLLDRKHKAFPITPDIIGQRIATTLQENILVAIDGDSITAWLE